MLYFIFVIPVLLLIISITLVVKLAFTGALISTLINTIYYCIFFAVMSTTGHPNSEKMSVNWAGEWKNIAVFLMINLAITLLLSWVISIFQST